MEHHNHNGEPHSAEHAPQGRKSLTETILIIAICAIILIGGFAVALVYPQVKAAWISRGLKDTDNLVRESTTEKLKGCGTAGRLAMLHALRTQEIPFPDQLQSSLDEILVEDVKAGRDIKPVIDAAVEGMREPGEIGKRCAAVASAGMLLGMLDDATKQAIVRRLLDVQLIMPKIGIVGHTSPQMKAFDAGFSKICGLRAHIQPVVDGKAINRNMWIYLQGKGHASYSWEFDTPGEHTMATKTTITAQKNTHAHLLDIYDNLPGSEKAWRMEIETEPIRVTVMETAPAGYLQAKVTPELAKRVKNSVTVKMEESQQPIFLGGGAISYTLPRIVVDSPLPADLAFRLQWQVKELNKTYLGADTTILQKDDGITLSALPPELVSELPYGKPELTIKLILDPSIDAALANPEVKAYWPEVIELEPFRMNVENGNIQMLNLDIVGD